LVWQPNSQFVSPYGSYEEEIQALRDTIALYSDSIEIWDTEGCFLSDSIYPDPLSPDPYHPQHASMATQAKYLARRYILNLKFGIELTTWTMTWDMTSLANNQGKSDWIDDYTDRTDFSFVEGPYMGLIYSPQNMYTHSLEGEHYSSIYPPMEVAYDPLAENDTCVWTPNGAGDSGYVYYDFSLLEPGWYTYWSRSVGINDSISIFLTFLDSTYFMIGNWYAVDEYRWSSAMSHYIRFFYLDSACHESYVITYWDGSKFDAWKLMRVDTVCLCKTGYYVLQSLCSVFDAYISTTNTITAGFTNINADSTTFSTLTYATFEHDVHGNYFIPYWFALVGEDNYNERLVRLTVDDTSLTYAKLINFFTGEVTDLEYSFIGDSVVFDSLPAADFPYCVATDFTPGVRECTKYAGTNVKMVLYPNPCYGHVNIQFSANGIPVRLIFLRIYDVTGRLVRDLSHEYLECCDNKLIWDCTDEYGAQVSAGIYFCQCSVPGFSQVEKFVLLK
jgi:hypothetical protein